MTSGASLTRALVLTLLVASASCGERTLSPMEQACAHRGRALRTGHAEPPRCGGTTFVAASPALMQALRGTSIEDVTRALPRTGAATLWVDLDVARRGSSVLARLSRAEHVEGFRTRAIDVGGLLVERFDWPAPTARESWALARVAREVLAGTPPPVLDQFPPSLRAPTAVEVMVLLRQSGSPTLWRSARGGSIASALLLALGVARSRWEERSSTLRGSIEERLPGLDVEVWLLAEDGTYATRNRDVIGGTLSEGFGVGFEKNDGWQYTLPEMLRGLRGVAAFESLFREHQLGARALDRSDIRLFRLVALRLGVSHPESARRLEPPSPGLIQADGDAL